ncbi:MAG: A24 family peptidase [Candidatus Aenigmatarchaeota archaeon]
MLELLLVAIALIGSLACGIYDLKTSNVPDKLVITMIVSALSIHAITGYYAGDFTVLIDSFLYGGLFLAFGLLMYFTGQWGGGDGELLVAMGIMLPTLSFVNTYFPFAISFFINSFFIGAAYSIIYSMVLVFKNPKIGKKFFYNMKDKKIIIALAASLSLSVAFLLIWQLILFSISFLSFIMIFFHKYSKTIEESFYMKIPVSKLKVDDMLGEDIPGLKLYKRYIKGLTEKQVKLIKKNRRYVVVREGIRYGIVFPLTLLFTLLFGDFFLLFI